MGVLADGARSSDMANMWKPRLIRDCVQSRGCADALYEHLQSDPNSGRERLATDESIHNLVIANSG